MRRAFFFVAGGKSSGLRGSVPLFSTTTLKWIFYILWQNILITKTRNTVLFFRDFVIKISSETITINR